MDKELVNILQAIVKAGFEVAIVGGAVRDFLAKKDISDCDFTINAMALRIENGKLKVEKDNLVDPFDGQKDLRNKLVRAVGDPDKRFREDALRLLRATRFATTLGFKIEDKTAAAIKKNAKLLSK